MMIFSTIYRRFGAAAAVLVAAAFASSSQSQTRSTASRAFFVSADDSMDDVAATSSTSLSIQRERKKDRLGSSVRGKVSAGRGVGGGGGGITMVAQAQAPDSDDEKAIAGEETMIDVQVLEYNTNNYGEMTTNNDRNNNDNNEGKSGSIIGHVLIDCNQDENDDAASCKERITNSIPDDAETNGCVIRFTQYLKLCNAWAAEIKDDPSNTIRNALDGIMQNDNPRELLYIPESVKVVKNTAFPFVTSGKNAKRELQQSSVVQQRQYTPYGISLIKAKDVWDRYKTKGENVRICVMDTGVNRDHSDLDQLFGYDGNELVQPWWRDVNGHGTHITGTIAANDNDRGVVGVAPGAEIFTARVWSSGGLFYSSNIITALQVCKDNDAQIISMSLGGYGYIGYEQQAYKDLYEKFNIVTVAASGNTGKNEKVYPASYDHVISVSSINSNRDVSSFSTSNDKVDVAAPGERIISTWEDGNYAFASGTSMAAPHVSGVVALMLSVNPSATPAQITDALRSSSENPNTVGTKDNDFGYGVVNALKAVETISGVVVVPDEDEIGETTIEFDGSSNNDDDKTDDDCIELVITLNTDQFASDTTHWLQSGTEYVFVQTKFDNYQTYVETACVDPNVCTSYNVRDSFGDGIKGEGVRITVNGIVEYTGGDFGIGGVKFVGNCY